MEEQSQAPAVTETSADAKTDGKPESSKIQPSDISPSTVQLFIEELHKLLPRDTVESKLRMTTTGLFLQEDTLSLLVEQYQRWLVRTTEGAVVKSPQKCMRRLFDSESPPHYYLLEGKQCLVGFQVPLQNPSPQKYALPIFRGSPLSTKDFLHPKDPLFTEHADLQAASKPEGLELHMKLRNGSFKIPAPALKQFVALASGSKLAERYPELGRSLRQSIKVLADVLERAAPPKQEQRLLIPARFKNARELPLLVQGSITFVIGRDGFIEDCYECEGRNLKDFFDKELQDLPKRLRDLKLENFQLSRRQGAAGPQPFGTVKILNDVFTLDVKLLADFAFLIKSNSTLRQEFKGKYTVGEMIKKILAILKWSERGFEPPRRRRGSSRRQPIRKRICKEFVFLVKDRNLIFRMFAEDPNRQQAQRPGGQPQAPGRGERDGRRRSRRRRGRGSPPGQGQPT